jgi:hypothetical protein
MTAMRRSAWAWVMAAGLAPPLRACAGPSYVVQQLGRPARSAASIAISRVNGKGPVVLAALDGDVP